MAQASFRVDGKIALITGGNRGIGRGCAEALAAAGASVAFTWRSHEDEAKQVVARIEQAGGKAMTVQADVSKREEIENAVQRTVETFGGLDIAVANAASSRRKAFLTADVEGVARTWDVCLWGTFHLFQLAANRMVEQGRGGRLICISSIMGEFPFSGAVDYCTAKAATIHMTRCIAAELAEHYITSNVITPGWTDTPGERAFTSEEEIRKKEKDLPWGRMGSIQEIGAAALYLASPAGEYVTGEVLRVDGGYHLPYRRGEGGPSSVTWKSEEQ